MLRMFGERGEPQSSFSGTAWTMDGIELREIRAINVLVCILNFYDLETVGPALRRALRDIFDVGETGNQTGGRSMTPRKRRLKSALADLGQQARTEEPSDQLVVSRMMPYQGKAPRLVGWENDLFRQLSAEFENEDAVMFAEWAIERAGLAAPQGSGMRGVLVLRAGDVDGTRQATLSRYAKAA
jgi:hypothetical protein